MLPLRRKVLLFTLATALALANVGVVRGARADSNSPQQDSPAAAKPAAMPMGTVVDLAGNVITIKTDSGTQFKVHVQESTRILRTVPGQKDLKGAMPLALQDLQSGDRLLVRGTILDDKSVMASTIVAMKQADLAERQKRELEDWQARGVGGLVSTVDAGKGIVMLSMVTGEGKKQVAVHVSNATIVRRYGPDSVRFDQTIPGTLDQIKPGDQLRARGTRSSDSTEIAADEIVFGSFRNIAGTLSAVDAEKGTLSIVDLATKKPVTVKIGTESQLKKLSPTLAHRLAAQWKTITGAPQPQAGGEHAPSPTSVANSAGGDKASRPLNVQRMLDELPPVGIAELQKGDAVILVATEGVSGAPTAITLLTGVEALLTAAPNGEAAKILSPWNIGGAAAAADAATP